MTVTADAKRRVVVPGIKPGDVFACERQDANHITLVKLVLPPCPEKRTRREIRRAIKRSKMSPTMTWDKLRAMTREL